MQGKMKASNSMDELAEMFGAIYTTVSVLGEKTINKKPSPASLPAAASGSASSPDENKITGSKERIKPVRPMPLRASAGLFEPAPVFASTAHLTGHKRGRNPHAVALRKPNEPAIVKKRILADNSGYSLIYPQ